MATAEGLITSRLKWVFMGKTRRHTLDFHHNTVSGSQTIFIDGSSFYESGWKYKLTGAVFFRLDGCHVELVVRPSDSGALLYSLSVDAREVQPSAGAAPGSPGGFGSGAGASPSAEAAARAAANTSTWIFATRDGTLHQVELLHEGLDVLVDGRRVEAAGDFVDEGSAYVFDVAGVEARILVVPLPVAERRAAGGASMRTTLELGDGIGVVKQSELLGQDA